MCLIAYVKAGAAIPEEYFRAAAYDNEDGIGVMSADGVEKFLGRKMVKRAWRYTRRLQEANHEFAVHFRFATHGRVALANTHPFRTPDGGSYVMHNGILSNYTPADKYGDMSDTRLMIEKVMDGVNVLSDEEYWKSLEDHIGFGNKLCVMDRDGNFRLVNEYAGDWIDHVWYSQTYSLPGMSATSHWWDKYDNDYTASTDKTMTKEAVGNYFSGGYGGSGGRTYIYRDGKYIESGASSENVALVPYEQTSVMRAYARRDADSAEGAGVHGLPPGTYVTPPYATRDDEALDAELEKHFASIADDDDPTDMCPSCETLHSEGRICPECGYEDMSEGMLGGYQAAAK